MSRRAAAPCVPHEFQLLLQCLQQVTDPRKARGKVHALPNVLALTVLGLMAGQDNLKAIAGWARRQAVIWQTLGLRRGPSVATLWRLTQQIRISELRAALAAWVREVRPLRHPQEDGATDPAASLSNSRLPPVVALDGKTLRGTWEAGHQLHVLHAFATESALLLDQLEAAGHFEEPALAQEWLTRLAEQFPTFQILTGDALYAEQSLCAAIVGAGKHYLVKVKKTNPPSSRMPSNSLPTPVIPR